MSRPLPPFAPAPASAPADRETPDAAPAAAPPRPRMLGLRDAPAPDRAEIGVKGAAVDALIRAGAPAPPAVMLIEADVADLRRRLADGAPEGDAAHWSDLSTALAEATRRLSAATGRAFDASDVERSDGALNTGARLHLAVRLSPIRPIADLAQAALAVGARLDAPVNTPVNTPANAPANAPAKAALQRLFWRTSAPRAAGPLWGDPRPDDEIAGAVEEAIEEARDAGADDAAQTAAARAALGDDADSAAARLADPAAQLLWTVLGMAAAWDSARAQRRRAALSEDGGCAIMIQAMPEAFGPPGRRDAPSGTGASAGAGRIRLYSPSSGRRKPAGRFAPLSLGGERAEGAPNAYPFSDDTLAADPGLAAAADLALRAEDALEAPQEIGFALDHDGETGGPRAWILSVAAQRASARAQARMAVDRAEEGRITRAQALTRVPARGLEELLHASVESSVGQDRIARGLPASPGAAVGKLVFSTEEAEALHAAGEAAILARAETQPEDVQGMRVAAGVLTTRGGLTSHAAVVARGLGAPCVVGAFDARIDAEAGVLTGQGGRVVPRGEMVTLDGASGDLLLGAAPLRRPEPTGALAKLMSWADDVRGLRVRANADGPADAETAIRFGVDGVGLCRTEHMFFDPDQITLMREVILAETEADRRAALDRLLPPLRTELARLFEIVAKGAATSGPPDAPVPVTVRLLDPPLHEFLPQDPRGVAALAAATGQTPEKIKKRARDLAEFNPMLGKRGCRVGVAYPEIYEMQARAIFEAALAAEAAADRTPRAEIMIPLVSAVREFELLKGKVDGVAAAVRAERGRAPDYTVGIMVETPRAALRADALGALSDFFSFGTNDLTQMTYGISRDDAGRLMRDYMERGVFEADPFVTLDEDGVGELMRIAVARGRAANPNIQIGLCGEHGGDPNTIAFCAAAGFDYVSCSPFRAPIARLAAAQAAIALAAKADEEERG